MTPEEQRRLKALMQMLAEDGHMTPEAVRQITRLIEGAG